MLITITKKFKQRFSYISRVPLLHSIFSLKHQLSCENQTIRCDNRQVLNAKILVEFVFDDISSCCYFDLYNHKNYSHCRKKSYTSVLDEKHISLKDSGSSHLIASFVFDFLRCRVCWASLARPKSAI